MRYAANWVLRCPRKRGLQNPAALLVQPKIRSMVMRMVRQRSCRNRHARGACRALPHALPFHWPRSSEGPSASRGGCPSAHGPGSRASPPDPVLSERVELRGPSSTREGRCSASCRGSLPIRCCHPSHVLGAKALHGRPGFETGPVPAIEVVAWLDITRRRKEVDGALLEATMVEYEAVVAMRVRLIEAIRPVGHGHPPSAGHGHPPSVGARGRTLKRGLRPLFQHPASA